MTWGGVRLVPRPLLNLFMGQGHDFSMSFLYYFSFLLLFPFFSPVFFFFFSPLFHVFHFLFFFHAPHFFVFSFVCFPLIFNFSFLLLLHICICFFSFIFLPVALEACTVVRLHGSEGGGCCILLFLFRFGEEIVPLLSNVPSSMIRAFLSLRGKAVVRVYQPVPGTFFHLFVFRFRFRFCLRFRFRSRFRFVFDSDFEFDLDVSYVFFNTFWFHLEASKLSKNWREALFVYNGSNLS